MLEGANEVQRHRIVHLSMYYENLLQFHQQILINWVPGSMGWAYEQRTKKFNKHEYLILNLGWHLLRSNKRHLTYNLNLY